MAHIDPRVAIKKNQLQMTDFKSVSGIKQKFVGLVKYKLSLMMEEIYSVKVKVASKNTVAPLTYKRGKCFKSLTSDR